MEINVNLVHTSRRTVKRGGDLIQRIIISGEVICTSSTYSIGCRNGISKARKCIFCARRRSYACSLEGRINAIFLRKNQLQHNESANEMDICVPGRAQQPFRRMRQPSIWSTNALNQKLWWTYFTIAFSLNLSIMKASLAFNNARSSQAILLDIWGGVSSSILMNLLLGPIASVQI